MDYTNTDNHMFISQPFIRGTNVLGSCEFAALLSAILTEIPGQRPPRLNDHFFRDFTGTPYPLCPRITPQHHGQSY
jgi:hypothetical protein